MKKWIAYLLSAAILLTAAGCGGSAGQPPAVDPPREENEAPSAGKTEEQTTLPPEEENVPAADGEQSPEPNSGSPSEQAQETTAAPEDSAAADPQAAAGQTETASASAPVVTPEPETPRILIAYFTWADNTVVEDPSAVDVDASTSASVLAPGNAAKIAGWVQQEVGGDLFSIVVSEPYSSDYDECLDRAADEKADNARPALVSHVSGMDAYDIVFLGFPNWWYTLPMAVLSFVEEYDFSGKTIVPFCTHGTGGLSSTIQDLTAALPGDVTILDPIGVYRPEVDSSRPAVREWVAGLDLSL